MRLAGPDNTRNITYLIPLYNSVIISGGLSRLRIVLVEAFRNKAERPQATPYEATGRSWRNPSPAAIYCSENGPEMACGATSAGERSLVGRSQYGASGVKSLDTQADSEPVGPRAANKPQKGSGAAGVLPSATVPALLK